MSIHSSRWLPLQENMFSQDVQCWKAIPWGKGCLALVTKSLNAVVGSSSQTLLSMHWQWLQNLFGIHGSQFFAYIVVFQCISANTCKLVKNMKIAKSRHVYMAIKRFSTHLFVVKLWECLLPNMAILVWWEHDLAMVPITWNRCVNIFACFDASTMGTNVSSTLPTIWPS